ncbi:MAG: methyltransferase domain-containing protein [Parcubacteria group bacterium]|jgi:ubiquinone/menaquinone biosynthesis C-methylase UbiE
MILRFNLSEALFLSNLFFMGDHLKKISKLKKLNFAARQNFHFDKKRAEKYENAHDYRTRTFDWMAKTIRPCLAQAESALDVGTGTGDLVRSIKIKGVFTGLDVSKNMLDVARKKCSHGNFVLGNAYSLPFDDESFEVVIYKYALHHLKRPLNSLIEAFRVMKNNGQVIIADVASFKNKSHHSIFKKLNSLREPANYEYRTIETILRLLDKAGFKKARIVKKDFNLILEDWLNHFYEPEKTINLVLDSPISFKEVIRLKSLSNQKHQITLTSFVVTAKK